MKTNCHFSDRRRNAFTLVELLVVMAVIATLAAILFPVFSNIKKGAAIKRARAEMLKVVMAIESYKAQMGHYPPDHVVNPTPLRVDPLLNSLYYELSGTTTNGNEFVTLDGSASIAVNLVSSTFARDGFVNCSRGGADDNAQRAQTFLRGLPPSQYFDLSNNVRLLTCSIKWPASSGAVIAGVPEVNPWRYVSTGATNNPGHFDLWVDIVVGGKTNRIGNWSEKPQIVP